MRSSGSVRHVRLVAVAVVAAICGATAAASLGGASSGTVAVTIPLDPVRILDTRRGVGAPAGPLGPGEEITLQVTGVAGVPSNAVGVVINLTSTGAVSGGFITAYPDDQERPNSSVINYTPGVAVANMVTATLGPSGALRLYSGNGTTHLIADVAGALVPGSGSSTGPAGPPGPAGPAGPAGPTGPAGPGAIGLSAEVQFNSSTELARVGSMRFEAECDLVPPGYFIARVRVTPSAGTGLLSFLGSYQSSANTAPQVQNLRSVGSLSWGIESLSPMSSVRGVIESRVRGERYQLDIHFVSAYTCIFEGSLIRLQ